MKTIRTERLILRSIKESDIKDIFDYAKSKVVGPMAGWKPHDNIEETVQIVAGFIEKDEVWGIYHKIDKKIIGTVGIHPDRKRTVDISFARELGYVLAEDYWGCGIMTEACEAVIRFVFEEMKLEILSVFHYPFNSRSKRVIEKLGFRHEGMLRKCSAIYDGTVYDLHCYSITADEYGQMKK